MPLKREYAALAGGHSSFQILLVGWLQIVLT